MSRRKFGKIIAGTVAGTMTGALAASGVSGEAQTEQKPSAPAAVPITTDPRIAAIEKSRGKPLTEAQRKTVLENFKNDEDAWSKGREFSVPDGTEPDFIFRPMPLSNVSDKGERANA